MIIRLLTISAGLGDNKPIESTNWRSSMKKTSYLIILVFLCSAALPAHAGNVLKDILKAYQTYQEINMTLWLVGDVGAEKRFGKELQFWLNLTNKPEKDPKINAYVRGIFDRLVPHYKNHGMRYTVHVIKNSAANAFAIPGGHIYVQTGLLNLVSSDDELATVLAHELAHAEKRHSLKNFRASTAAVALLNAAVKNRKDRETWGALLTTLTMMKFSRTQEDEADDIGQFRMAAAGFNPAAQVAVWEKFLKKYGDTRGVQQYLSSHPPSSQRIENARNNLKKMNVSPRTVFANTRNLMSATRQNLLVNPSFETLTNNQVAGWQTAEGRAFISDKFAVTGRQSLQMVSEARINVTRVLSEFIPVNQNSDFSFSGYMVSEDGSQNAAIGIELYDAQKRLRNRIWAVRKSAPVPAQLQKFETRLVNSPEQRIFAGNTAFMRILLQTGLVSQGSVWFDELRLKNTNTPDPVNLLAGGDLETAANNLPVGILTGSTGLSIDLSKANTGYASLRISGDNSEKSFSFTPVPLAGLKKDQMLAGSFFFNGDGQIKGTVLVELVDANGKPLTRKLAQIEFETAKDQWSGTSFSFKLDIKKEEEPLVKALQIRIVSIVPAGANL
jgi:Zn-dependent protease with chaperone function